MAFNTNRHELMHFGKVNRGRTYIANGRTLGSVHEQRNLRIQTPKSGSRDGGGGEDDI